MLGPEERHHVYKMLRLRVLVHKDTTLEVSGAFGDDLAGWFREGTRIHIPTINNSS
jgi:hypothetical protein